MNPIQLFIPRDVNMHMPDAVLQNVIGTNYTEPFYLHVIDMTEIRTDGNIDMSLHIEIHPLKSAIGYYLIYKFSDRPRINDRNYLIDGWSLYCPLSEFVLPVVSQIIIILSYT